ncbi:MAG: divalent metal cation transporter FieF, partial [Phototrophicales bacterium]
DLISNTGILIGLGLYYLGYIYADPIIGLMIALYILKCAFEIGYDSAQLLLDRELPKHEQEQIHEAALSVPGVIDVHDLRTRQSGSTKFIQLHAVMDGNMTLSQAHDIALSIHSELDKLFPDADVIIHEDPHT